MNFPSDQFIGKYGTVRRKCCYCLSFETTTKVIAAKACSGVSIDKVIQPYALVVGCPNGYNKEYMIPQHSVFLGLVNAMKIHVRDDYIFVNDKKRSINKKIIIKGLKENSKVFFQ